MIPETVKLLLLTSRFDKKLQYIDYSEFNNNPKLSAAILCNYIIACYFYGHQIVICVLLSIVHLMERMC